MARPSRKPLRQTAAHNEDFDLPEDIPKYVLRSIGSVTADWAALEYIISDLTWRLAAVYPALGACLTAQIYTFNGRLDSLIALLKIRQASKRLISDMHTFAEDSRGPQESRNRMVHDVWTRSRRTGDLMRLEIKAKAKLSFDLLMVAQGEVTKDERRIREFVLSFIPLRNRILGELSTLPEIPLQSLERVTPHPPQTRAND
jgi:hypothetical protein